MKEIKSSQLQIRINPEEKKLIAKAAKRAGLDISTWVLRKIINYNQEKFFYLIKQLSFSKEHRFILSELNDWLLGLSKEECEIALQQKPDVNLSNYLANYVAAMIEVLAQKKKFTPPHWLKEIQKLKEPHFETKLESLKLYLLINSPLPFKIRGIFLDSTIGDRV